MSGVNKRLNVSRRAGGLGPGSGIRRRNWRACAASRRRPTEANARLAATNQGLERRVEETSLESAQQVTVLNVAHEVLNALPLGVLGVGDEGLVAIANRVAIEILESMSPLPVLGTFASTRLPRELLDCLAQVGQSGQQVYGKMEVGAGQNPWEIIGRRLGLASEGRGYVLVMIPAEAK